MSSRSSFRQKICGLSRTMSPGAPPTAVLAVIAAAGPFSTDAYVSALPHMQHDLGTSSQLAQVSMTACIVGLAVGMTVSGPISDGRGRRPFLLGGAATFALASVVCAVAGSIYLLILARLLQGLAAGAAAPIARAVISDSVDDDEASKRFGTLVSVALLAPVVSPAIGGLLLGVGSWRAVFWFLASVGVVMVTCIVVLVPESLPAHERQPNGLTQLWQRVADLLTDRAYLGPLLVQCVAIAGLFVYVGGSAFILQDGMDVSARLYSTIFATDAAAMAATSIAFRFTVERVGPQRLRLLGLCLSALGALTLLLLAQTADAPPLAAVWTLLATTLAGLGLSFPAATVLAQNAGRRSAGTAASLLNGTGYLIAALAVPLTGLINSTDLRVMALLMSIFFAVPAAALVACALRSRTGLRPRVAP